MKSFNFYVSADNFTYTLIMPTVSHMGKEYIVYRGDDELRHPDFRQDKIGNLGNIGSMQSLTDMDTFIADFNSFVFRLNHYATPIDGPMLERIFVDICGEHILKYGRLFYQDLLNYADLYIHLNYAMFQSELSVYQNIYQASIYKVLNRYPDDVIFTGPFGSTYTWTQAH